MMASCSPLTRDRTEMENAAARRVLILLACAAMLCSGSLGHDAATTDGGQNISVAEARQHVSSGPAGGRSLAQEAAPSSTALPFPHTGTLRSSQAGSSASPFPGSLENISFSEPHPPARGSSEKGGAEDRTRATTTRGSSEKGGAEDRTRPSTTRGSSEKGGAEDRTRPSTTRGSSEKGVAEDRTRPTTTRGSSEKGGAEDRTRATTTRGSSEKGGAEDRTRPTTTSRSSEKTRPGAAPRRDALVGRCLLTIAVMAAVSSVFIISTICLATRLSEFRRRGRGQLQDTEMVCISALMNDTDHPVPTRLPRSNGALIPDGDHLTLDSFLNE